MTALPSDLAAARTPRRLAGPLAAVWLAVVAAPAAGQDDGGPTDLLGGDDGDAAALGERLPGPLPTAPDSTAAGDGDAEAAGAASNGDATASGAAARPGGDADSDASSDGGAVVTSEPAELEVAPLADATTGWLGVLARGEGGLGARMWAGTDARLVKRGLAQLGVRQSSPAVRDLARRLLMSNARGPVLAHADEAARAEAERDLLFARLDRLIAMGALDAAERVIAAQPADGGQGLLARRADIAFLRGDSEEACILAEEGISGDPDPYWQQARVLCHLRAGNQIEAELALDVLRESGFTDPLFDTVVEALIFGESLSRQDLPAHTRISPLEVALLRTAEVAPPRASLAESSPAVWAALARGHLYDGTERLAVAERAAGYGALAPTELARLYGAVDFDDSALAALLDSAEDAPRAAPAADAVAADGPRRRALLFRGAQIELNPARRAEVLTVALGAARAAGQLPLMARVLEPLLADVTPEAARLAFAPHAVRAYLAADRPARARDWLDVLRQADRLPPATRSATADLMPLLALAPELGGTPPRPIAGVGLRAWLAARLGQADPAGAPLGDSDARPPQAPAAPISTAPDAATARAELGLVATLAAGLDVALPMAVWPRLLASEGAPGVAAAAALDGRAGAQLQALRAAGRAGRRGETVLLALALIGEHRIDRLSQPLIEDILEVLGDTVGRAQTRRIALDAALAKGL